MTILHRSLDSVRKKFARFHSSHVLAHLGNGDIDQLIQNAPRAVPRSEVSAGGPKVLWDTGATSPG